MASFAIGGILSSSTILLRLAAYIAPPLLLVNIGLAIADVVRGWPSAFHLLVTLDLMYVVTFIAVLCIYQARVYKDGVERPIFIVDWQHTLLDDHPAASAADGVPRRKWTTNRTLRRPASPEREEVSSTMREVC